MKRVLGAVTLSIILLALVFTGCQAKKSDDKLAVWLANARLDADDTNDELYERARDEGILTVYSTSTRMIDVAKSFERNYPGLLVKVLDVRPADAIAMLKNSADAGEYDCDVFLCSDSDGVMAEELLPKGYIFKYVPSFLKDRLIPGSDGDVLTLMYEAIMFVYNDEIFAAPPVSNWWELTEPQWRGKVYMPNPVRSVTTFGFLSMFIKNEAAFARAHEQRYGKPPETLPGEGAGKAFFRALAANGLVLTNSSDEVAQCVGEPGIKDANVGIMVSSKLRLCDVGYTLAVSNDMQPYAGVMSPNNIMLAGGSKNINAAKLFIRWLFGEADGQGEGYKPYLQNGAWSVRTDVRSESALASEQMNVIGMDTRYIYDNKDDVMAFWQSIVGEVYAYASEPR